LTICDLNSGQGQLAHAFAKLKERLVEIKTDWNDGTLQQFEATHLAPIPARLQQLMAAVQRLSETLAIAERDCEDRPETET
jgi:hypothetical protein